MITRFQFLSMALGFLGLKRFAAANQPPSDHQITFQNCTFSRLALSGSARWQQQQIDCIEREYIRNVWPEADAGRWDRDQYGGFKWLKPNLPPHPFLNWQQVDTLRRMRRSGKLLFVSPCVPSSAAFLMPDPPDRKTPYLIAMEVPAMENRGYIELTEAPTEYHGKPFRHDPYVSYYRITETGKMIVADL